MRWMKDCRSVSIALLTTGGASKKPFPQKGIRFLKKRDTARFPPPLGTIDSNDVSQTVKV